MAVLDPLKLTITNFDPDATEQLEVANHPKDPALGKRVVPLTQSVYIDRSDFRLEANRKYKRLVLGQEVRLRGAYVIKAMDVRKNGSGEIEEVFCEYDPKTLGVNPEGRKVRGVIQWVSATFNAPATFKRFEPLLRCHFPTPKIPTTVTLLIPTQSRSLWGS